MKVNFFMPTTLIIVRHGQSISNVNETFTGGMDSPLSELGHMQAARTAAYLKDYPISAVYSSDLSRAMQTAAPVAEMHGLQIMPDKRLREICGGDWEGRRGDEIAKLYPDNYALWKTDVYRCRPNGGENITEVAARVSDFLQEILTKHSNECVAIFSHALAMRTLACQWFDLSLDQITQVPWSANASVSVAEYNGNQFSRLVLYGYDGHQGDLSSVLSKGLS